MQQDYLFVSGSNIFCLEREERKERGGKEVRRGRSALQGGSWRE